MKNPHQKQSHQIYAVGYSTRSIRDFLELLLTHQIELVIDIRTIPKSRHCPDFNEDALISWLHLVHIKYRHIKELGGLRHPKKVQ